MSLESTGLRVWSVAKPPLGILIAGRATEMLAAPFPEEVRAPFAALFDALVAWWPGRRREPREIYSREFSACLQVGLADPRQHPVLTGAYLQMAALSRLAPRTLPADGFYDMNEANFVSFLRDAAKAGRLPLAQLEARLAYVLARADEKLPWPELVACTGRMRWAPGPAWGKLDKRVHELASFADLGASATWGKIGAQDVLQLQLGATKRAATLTPEEVAALRELIPSIPAPS